MWPYWEEVETKKGAQWPQSPLFGILKPFKFMHGRGQIAHNWASCSGCGLGFLSSLVLQGDQKILLLEETWWFGGCTSVLGCTVSPVGHCSVLGGSAQQTWVPTGLGQQLISLLAALKGDDVSWVLLLPAGHREMKAFKHGHFLSSSWGASF